jgi:uncharacterized integral membrane protein (TIGR00697 family)
LEILPWYHAGKTVFVGPSGGIFGQYLFCHLLVDAVEGRFCPTARCFIGDHHFGLVGGPHLEWAASSLGFVAIDSPHTNEPRPMVVVDQFGLFYFSSFLFIRFYPMMHQILKDRPTKLFLGIMAFFVANALIAECIGGKIFSLEKTLGWAPTGFTLFGQSGLSFNLTCGVLLWPLEFIVTDLVNEYYGPKAVKRISYTAVVLILYAFVMFYAAMKISPADFWVSSRQTEGIPNMQLAFGGIFGQGMWIIIGSLTAFLVSQLVDVLVFHRIKKMTGEKYIWLRATGSTVVSQFVDSFVVLFIAFKIGNGWTWQLVLAICLVNYVYKFSMAILLTPLIYWLERKMENYLGKEKAREMKLAAMGQPVA